MDSLILYQNLKYSSKMWTKDFVFKCISELSYLLTLSEEETHFKSVFKVCILCPQDSDAINKKAGWVLKGLKKKTEQVLAW